MLRILIWKVESSVHPPEESWLRLGPKRSSPSTRPRPAAQPPAPPWSPPPRRGWADEAGYDHGRPSPFARARSELFARADLFSLGRLRQMLSSRLRVKRDAPADSYYASRPATSSWGSHSAGARHPTYEF